MSPMGSMDVKSPSRPRPNAKALRIPLLIAGACLSAMLVSCSSPAPAATPDPPQDNLPVEEQAVVQARVVRVVDGATIDVDVDGEIVRVGYLGVEIADVEQVKGDTVSVAERAMEFNRFLVEGKMVRLERGGPDLDSAGRRLRYVYAQGEMVNMALLTNGYAIVAASPPNFLHKTDFVVAETAAKEDKRGAWKSHRPGPQPTPTTGPFTGGTLPMPSSVRRDTVVCDFSGTSLPAIKGNVDQRTKERVYHVPGGLFYATTEVRAEDGDRLFCTEQDAVEAGWSKAAH